MVSINFCADCARCSLGTARILSASSTFSLNVSQGKRLLSWVTNPIQQKSRSTANPTNLLKFQRERLTNDEQKASRNVPRNTIHARKNRNGSGPRRKGYVPNESATNTG